MFGLNEPSHRLFRGTLQTDRYEISCVNHRQDCCRNDKSNHRHSQINYRIFSVTHLRTNSLVAVLGKWIPILILIKILKLWQPRFTLLHCALCSSTSLMQQKEYTQHIYISSLYFLSLTTADLTIIHPATHVCAHVCRRMAEATFQVLWESYKSMRFQHVSAKVSQ